MLTMLWGVVTAQEDPIIMTIAGQEVTRSEFEYSYNKNNGEGVIDKKNIDEYVDLFINYKLKVVAALDEHLDTMAAFKKEFRQYRDQQIRPSIINDDDIEREAHRIYDRTKANIGEAGLIKPQHIFLKVSQTAPQEEIDRAKERIDSIYEALQNGVDFAELAHAVSQDVGSARVGGELPWLSVNQTVPEFEAAAFALQPGEMSKPVQTPYGLHIIYMMDRKDLEPYDTLRAEIVAYINNRNVRDRIIDTKIDSLAKTQGISKIEYMDNLAATMAATDDDLKNLIREYHDGLLLYEISNRNIWEKAAKDEAGLSTFFEEHKAKYAWDEPRFKGMVYHVKVQSDVKAVKNSVKKVPFDGWAEVLKTTFNNDSIIRIRVEKGLFKQGDNGFVDKEVFKVADAQGKKLENYPIDAVYGKKLKAPEDYTDVRGLVTADYQEELEKAWVEELRAKYTVTINKEVLATVNQH